MTLIRCTNCKSSYPDDHIPYKCVQCGDIYDFETLSTYRQDLVEKDSSHFPGIWRYHRFFGIEYPLNPVTLGEGNTPLVWKEIKGVKVGFKLEFINPTGSFKDRGTAVLVSFLQSRGVKTAVEDSSGNAGASFAAYAASAGISAKVFVPDYASVPKQNQISIYGAEVVRIMGPRSNATLAVQKVADGGIVYASHAYLPFGIPGFTTIAFELYQQLGASPGTIIAPCGQGSLMLGIGRGFQSLKMGGVIKNIPRLVGVQAQNCAPLWAVYNYGHSGLSWVTEGDTIAEGVRIKHPLRGDKLISMIKDSGGAIIAIEEDKIISYRSLMARMGLFVEPTSAIVWGGLMQILDEFPGPIVVILTGSGLKAAHDIYSEREY